MADIEVRRAHALGLEGARRAAEQLAADLGRKLDLRSHWEGNVLHFERAGVAGTLTVSPRDLHLEVSLGYLLKAMKPSVEKAILQQVDALFAPSAASPPAPERPRKA